VLNGDLDELMAALRLAEEEERLAGAESSDGDGA
jgi:hypothetical protein